MRKCLERIALGLRGESRFKASLRNRFKRIKAAAGEQNTSAARFMPS